MTKQEIEKAIENGEDVWCIIRNCIQTIELNEETCGVSNDEWLIKNYHHPDMFKPEYLCKISKIFKTKAEAEHYLHHANITRAETLPFLTWEEFLGEKELFFTNASGYPMCLTIVNTNLGKKIGLGGANGYFDLQQIWDLTEENFFKAYDECERLFKGRSDINEVEK